MPLVVTRQVVLTRPVLDLQRVTVGPAVAVGTATISLLKELLVLALQLVVQDDAIDSRTALLEALGFALVRPVDLRVVLDLTWLLQLRVEPLSPVVLVPATAALAVAAAGVLFPMRLQQILAAVRQDDDAMAVAGERNGANKTLLAEVTKVALARVAGLTVVVLQVTRWNDAEDPDETQRAGFGTTKRVLPVAVTDQLAFVSARQVELVDEDVPRIDRVSVACVVVAFTRIASPTRIIIKHGRNLLK
ncbi:MAG: hypothetical protein A3H97_11395 [Acidobacteria bacterium RIFCSPLOWO2_02_FULL_65_29]|nr:MAG: hypothetical protein A3H97_11395 [Acidobacteria bacterium RIFCSPLOWO2_02_FULL_65_29]